VAYQARHNAPPAPNLVKRPFHADHPDRIWMADVTFIRTRQGWFVCGGIDRSVFTFDCGLGDEGSAKPGAGQAFLMAIEQRAPEPGQIHHSDQGILYAGGRYIELLKRSGMIRSMSGKGNCYDNAVVESFFSSLKNEIIHHRD
jgi:putative transposase